MYAGRGTGEKLERGRKREATVHMKIKENYQKNMHAERGTRENEQDRGTTVRTQEDKRQLTEVYVSRERSESEKRMKNEREREVTVYRKIREN